MKVIMAFTLVMIAMIVGFCYQNKQKEITKQKEIQLQIEMVKAGVTNVPSITDQKHP